MGKISTSIIRNGVEYKVESIDEFEEQLDSSSTAGLSDEHRPPNPGRYKPQRARSWNRSNTELFVNECLRHKADFLNPKIRRRQIFTDIRLKLMEKGVNINEDNLDRKFRNLKIRYNHIKQSKKRKSHNTWPYFEQLDSVFSTDVKPFQCLKTLRHCPPVKTIVSIPKSYPRRAIQSLIPKTTASSSNNKEDTPPAPVDVKSPNTDGIDSIRNSLLALEERRTIAIETIAAQLMEANRLTRLKMDLKMGREIDEFKCGQ